MHRRLADPRGLHRPVRRAHHRAAPARGRGDPRQDEHGRVRDGLVDRAHRLRPGRQSVGPRAGSGRLLGGSAASRSPPYHAPLSIGTDTGGSIRQPAALTGTSSGIKPTYGRVSPLRDRRLRVAPSTRSGRSPATSRDAATLLHAIAGRDERDSTSAAVPVPDELLALPTSDDEAAGSLRGKRLGLPREYFVAGHGARRRVAGSSESVAALEAAGATVEDVSCRTPTTASRRTTSSRRPRRRANLARYDGVRFGPRARRAATCWRTTSRRAARLRRPR